MLISGILSDGLIKILVWVVTGIYKIAAGAFEVFMILASGQIISEDSYKVMLENVYVILGVIMLFIVAFSLLQMMINPDDQKKGASSIKKVIINLITSAIIMAVLPTVFTFAYDFQNSFINEYNVIGRFFGYGNLGSSPIDDENRDVIKTGSYQLVNGVFTAFFNVNPDACIDKKIIVEDNETMQSCQKEYYADEPQTFEHIGCNSENDTDKSCKHSFAGTIQEVSYTGKFGYYNDFSKEVDDGNIDFNFIMCLIAGFILIYVGISFCFDMAVRLIKLVFYQLIAPIPIFFRVIPEGKLSGTFKQWAKVTLTCYLEVYIRIFVVYFCIYLCKKILDSHFITDTIWTYGGFPAIFATAFMLMGIVIFMKQAPKLISEITGLDSGNMKLGIKDKLKEGGFFAAANAVGGFAFSKGNPLGAIRGFKHGWKNADFKGIGAEDTRRKSWEDATGKGARRRDLIKDDIRSAFGFESEAEAAERRVRQGRLPGGKKITVKNTAGKDLKYGSGANDVIKNGVETEMTEEIAEKLKSHQKILEGQMQPTKDKIDDLEKRNKFAQSLTNLKSTYETEAVKKWEKGKFSTEVWWQDANGNIYHEKIYKDRFDELNRQGVKYLKSGDGIRYVDHDGKKYSLDELKGYGFSNDVEIQNSGFKLDEDSLSYFKEQNDVRDKMVKEFHKAEHSKDDYVLMNSKLEQALKDLKEPFNYEITTKEIDEHGKPIRKNAILSYSKEERTLTHKEGEKITTYKDLGDGVFEKTEDGKSEKVYAFDISELLDSEGKKASTTIGDDIYDANASIQSIQEEYDNTGKMLNQYEKGKAQELEGFKYRGLRATSDYHKNNK